MRSRLCPFSSAQDVVLLHLSGVLCVPTIYTVGRPPDGRPGMQDIVGQLVGTRLGRFRFRDCTTGRRQLIIQGHDCICNGYPASWNTDVNKGAKASIKTIVTGKRNELHRSDSVAALIQSPQYRSFITDAQLPVHLYEAMRAARGFRHPPPRHRLTMMPQTTEYSARSRASQAFLWTHNISGSWTKSSSRTESMARHTCDSSRA